MNDKQYVCKVDEFGTGERRTVEISGREFAVFNVAGSYYAILNTCAHDSGPLDEGKVCEQLDIEITSAGERDVEYFSDRHSIVCPLHGWEYDLESGVHVGDTKIRLPTIDVVTEDGELYLDLGG